jgi:Kef-type K+ transport system membrane component KefB
VRRSVVLYAGLILASVCLVALLLRFGAARFPAAAAPPPAASAPAVGVLARLVANAAEPTPRVLVQLLVIVLAGRACGRLVRRAGQPRVVGEIAAGILIGPSVLGALAPTTLAALFPPASLGSLQLLSELGVLLFMFVVGLQLDVSHLRGRTPAAVAVSHLSIAVPFVLGVLLAIGLYPAHAPAGVPFTPFALFFGVAMSITAFPVLARILEERGLLGTALGATALTCAAVDDVTAWSLLAFVSAVTTSAGATATLAAMVAASAAFVAGMLALVRPLLARLVGGAATGPVGQTRFAIALVVLLASALTTHVIGIHALFGAFLAGVVMPRQATFRAALRERLEPLSAVLLLPVFFAVTGLRTEIGALSGPGDWLIGAGIVLAATLGKAGGTVAGARWTGSSWREAVALGALMNTRGLMELVALNLGYDLGILSPRLFTMLLLMALATTAMTGPLLALATRRPSV